MDPTKPSEDQTQPTATQTADEPVVEKPTEQVPAGDATSVPVADAPVPTPVPTPVAEEKPAVVDTTPVTPKSEEEGGTGGATV